MNLTSPTSDFSLELQTHISPHVAIISQISSRHLKHYITETKPLIFSCSPLILWLSCISHLHKFSTIQQLCSIPGSRLSLFLPFPHNSHPIYRVVFREMSREYTQNLTTSRYLHRLSLVVFYFFQTNLRTLPSAHNLQQL